MRISRLTAAAGIATSITLLMGLAPAQAEVAVGHDVPTSESPSLDIPSEPQTAGGIPLASVTQSRQSQPRAKADARLTIRVLGLPARSRPVITVSGQRADYEFTGLTSSKPVPSGEYVVKAQAITRGESRIKPRQSNYVVSTVTGAESILTIHYGKGPTPSSISLPALKRGAWTGRFQVGGQKKFAKSGTLARPVIVRNVPAGWANIRLTGSGRSLAAKPAAFRWNATPAVSLRVLPKIVPNSGTLAVTFTQAPATLTPRVVLSPTRGRAITISKATTRLPVGTYTVWAPPVANATNTYLPTPSAGVVEIRAGEASRLTVDYTSQISGPAVTDPEIDVVDPVGPIEKPQRITLRTKAPLNAKVVLPVSRELPGGFVGIVVEQRGDGSVVAERRPILSVIPKLAVNYRVSEKEIQSALRSYARTYAREAGCSVSALFSLLKSTAPTSAYGDLDADIFGIHRAGVSVVLNSGADKAEFTFTGSCSLDLPPLEMPLPTPAPLWLYFQASVGTSFSITGAAEGAISPSASLEVGALYDEGSGWRTVFQPTIDIGARSLTGSWTYTFTLPELSGELGISPLPRAVSGVADLAVGVQVSSSLGLKGPQVVQTGERCWGQIFRSFSLDAVARASVLDGRIGGDVRQELYSPDDLNLGDPFWCFPVTDEPTEMAVGNCTSIANVSLISFVGAVVPCTDEHTGQTLLVEGWPDGIAPPWMLDEMSETDVRRKAYREAVEPFREECFDIGADLLGVREGYWNRSGIFNVHVIGPNKSDWQQGKRWLACELVARETLSPGAEPTLVPIPTPSQLPGFARSSGFERYRLCRYLDRGRNLYLSLACSSLLADYLDFAWFKSPYDYTSAFDWRSAQRDAERRCADIGRAYFGITSGLRTADDWYGPLLPSVEQFANINFVCMVDR